MQKIDKNPTTKSDMQLFFEELAEYYWHENDLSNITVALCKSSPFFKEQFLRFFFPSLNLKDIEDIRREVWDSRGLGCRVDIHILMKSGELYIIEVKINDKNHHFDTYQEAYIVDRHHFGYITNYYCYEGKELGVDIKTWEDFYDHLSETNKHPKFDDLSAAFLAYLGKVCEIKNIQLKWILIHLRQFCSFFRLRTQ